MAQANVFFDTEPSQVPWISGANVQVAIQQSAVLLAIIGRRWFSARRVPEVLQRLLGKQGSTDFVQGELEGALQWSVPIVPLLVDGASMPSLRSLPEPVRELTFLNAISVRGGRDFGTDMDSVLSTIGRYMPPQRDIQDDPLR